MLLLVLAILAVKLPVTPVMVILNLPWFFRSGFVTGPMAIVVGLLFRKLPAKVAMAGCIFITFGAAFVYAVVLLLPVGTSEAGYNIWLGHSERYGFVGYPNSHGTNWNQPNFGPTEYSFDDEGWRTTIDARKNVPRIVFVGCSFTFGIGCRDREAFPGKVAEDFWTDYHVLNCALAGKGTTTAYLIVEDQLNRDRPPELVIYAYIADHIPRNSLRQSWWRNGFGPTAIPQFEVTNGKLEYLGLKDKSDATLPDSDELTRREIEITVALVNEMHEMCMRKKTKFYMLLLNEKDQDPNPDPVIEKLSDLGVPMIDARNVSNSFFENDPHPTKEWHAAIARFLAETPELQYLRGGNRPHME